MVVLVMDFDLNLVMWGGGLEATWRTQFGVAGKGLLTGCEI